MRRWVIGEFWDVGGLGGWGEVLSWEKKWAPDVVVAKEIEDARRDDGERFRVVHVGGAAD